MLNKYIYAGLIFVIFSVSGYSYYQGIQKDKLEKKISELKIDLQNRVILLQLCETNSKIKSFEDEKKLEIEKEKGKEYEKTPDSIGDHTISFK